MIGGLGVTELVIILIIVIVIFGARRLPELGKGVGEAIKNFKKATTERDEIDVTPKEGGNKDSSQDKGEKS